MITPMQPHCKAVMCVLIEWDHSSTYSPPSPSNPAGSSGRFKHRVREEGTYKLAVAARDSENNRIILAKSVTVQFD